MEQHSFGHWLKLKRKALDLTREELAERVGYSAATIRKIEDEERNPSQQVVERLAEFFRIPPDQRTAFLRFARGDWRSAPESEAESVPWMIGSQLQLATFLFTDIEGSAKLWETAQEKMKIALQRHHGILQEAITSNGGTVFQVIGDAFCAAFPTVLYAVAAAVKAQGELYREQWDLPFPIRVRMGIHTGEAERTSNDNYASGPTLNRVSRILSAGHGGQILLSLATKDLVKDSLPANTELSDMGEHYLKNLMYPEHLFQLNVAGLPTDFPPLNTLTRRHNLPTQLTSFIAREAEIALLHEYLSKDDIRLVTLIGPPGIGKTRLSIEAARSALLDFPDGVFFVALAALDNPDLIAVTVAQALGYVGLTNISTVEQLKEGIGEKQMLLVLDNCEHLIEDAASLASELLSSCPHLKIMATSRETLRVSGEWLYPVPALDIPAFDGSDESSSTNMETVLNFPALALFAERARAVRPDFTLKAENLKTVSTICAHLDGLPLAIELIAARIRLMSPQALLERLNDQFVLSADGMRAASTRQKTLQNAIGWSYDLLAEEEQKLLAHLSVFSGGFTLDVAEAMFSQFFTNKPVTELIASLLDKSLLRYDSAQGTGGEIRYTMLVTIQDYAGLRLRQMSAETETRNRHLAYFLDLTKNADKELRGPNQLEWLRRLGADVGNLRTALDWAIESQQTEMALQLVRKLAWFWFIRADHTEGRQWLQRVLDMPQTPLFPEAHAEALTQLAQHIWLQTGEKEARPSVEQALSIARAHNDKHNTARALSILGLVLIYEANFVAAEIALEEGKALFQEVGDKWGYAHAVTCHALAARLQEDWTTVNTLSQQGLALFREVGDQYFQSVSLRDLGIRLVKQGDTAQAKVFFAESLILAQHLDSKFEIATVLRRVGEAEQRAGNPARAVVLYSAAQNVFDSIGVRTLLVENDLAPCRAALGETAFEEAVEMGRLMTMEQAIAYALEEQE